MAQATAEPSLPPISYTLPRLAMDGTQFDATASQPPLPFDFNTRRALDQRTPENQPFVYTDDLHKSIRLAFTRHLSINVGEGTDYQ